MTPSRRDFLRKVAGTSGAVVAGSVLGKDLLTEEAEAAGLPTPAKSGIEHVVVVMMENRSFDHFLGWLPDAHGKQAGLSYKDSSRVAHKTYLLTSYTVC